MRRALLISVLMLPSLAFAQGMAGHPAGGAMPTQPGQAGFAAIQEIVQLLEADPATNWKQVNIEALRQHLVDMDNVTMRADVRNKPIAGGMVFIVSGSGAVRESIRRMLTAHAMTMNGNGDWKFTAARTETGAALSVTVPPQDEVKLRALGFIGLMTRGMHHQMHHLAIARGGQPHHH